MIKATPNFGKYRGDLINTHAWSAGLITGVLILEGSAHFTDDFPPWNVNLTEIARWSCQNSNEAIWHSLRGLHDLGMYTNLWWHEWNNNQINFPSYSNYYWSNVNEMDSEQYNFPILFGVSCSIHKTICFFLRGIKYITWLKQESMLQSRTQVII